MQIFGIIVYGLVLFFFGHYRGYKMYSDKIHEKGIESLLKGVTLNAQVGIEYTVGWCDAIAEMSGISEDERNVLGGKSLKDMIIERHEKAKKLHEEEEEKKKVEENISKEEVK